MLRIDQTRIDQQTKHRIAARSHTEPCRQQNAVSDHTCVCRNHATKAQTSCTAAATIVRTPLVYALASHNDQMCAQAEPKIMQSRESKKRTIAESNLCASSYICLLHTSCYCCVCCCLSQLCCCLLFCVYVPRKQRLPASVICCDSLTIGCVSHSSDLQNVSE